jgi:hypothetical protein
MQLIEVPGLAEPTLIDPALLGVLYVATGTLLVDIYTGLSTNEVPHPPGVRCAVSRPQHRGLLRHRKRR